MSSGVWGYFDFEYFSVFRRFTSVNEHERLPQAHAQQRVLHHQTSEASSHMSFRSWHVINYPSIPCGEQRIWASLPLSANTPWLGTFPDEPDDIQFNSLAAAIKPAGRGKLLLTTRSDIFPTWFWAPVEAAWSTDWQHTAQLRAPTRVPSQSPQRRKPHRQTARHAPRATACPGRSLTPPLE